MAEFLTMAEAEEVMVLVYAGTAASNFNAINTAINTVTDRCPSCTAQ